MASNSIVYTQRRQEVLTSELPDPLAHWHHTLLHTDTHTPHAHTTQNTTCLYTQARAHKHTRSALTRHVRTHVLMFHSPPRATPNPCRRQWRYSSSCVVLRSDLRSYDGVGCFAARDESENEEKSAGSRRMNSASLAS